MPSTTIPIRNRVALYALLWAPLLSACDGPQTFVVLDNQYSPSSALVSYHAFWQAVSFQTAVSPGASSDPQSTVAASPNPAYVVLAPGWDPTSGMPTTLIAMQSVNGFEVHLNNTLHIPVNDTTFNGNCKGGHPLAQADADFITQRVFANDFARRSYDAATCTMTAR